MSNCPHTLNDIIVECGLTAGGITRVLVAPKDFINIPAPNTSTNKIDVSLFTATDTSIHFTEYKFRPQTSSITSTATVDPAIGSTSVSTDITLQFTKMETDKRVALQLLISVGAIAFIKTYDGAWFFVGKDMPIYATSVVQQSGTAITDLNGYTVTLNNVSLELPYTLDGTEQQINALLTNVPVAP